MEFEYPVGNNDPRSTSCPNGSLRHITLAYGPHYKSTPDDLKDPIQVFIEGNWLDIEDDGCVRIPMIDLFKLLDNTEE